jgi:hypothetical protein
MGRLAPAGHWRPLQLPRRHPEGASTAPLTPRIVFSRRREQSARSSASSCAATSPRWAAPADDRLPAARSPVALAAWMLDHDPDSYGKISKAFVGRAGGQPQPGQHPRQHHAVLGDGQGASTRGCTGDQQGCGASFKDPPPHVKPRSATRCLGRALPAAAALGGTRTTTWSTQQRPQGRALRGLGGARALQPNPRSVQISTGMTRSFRLQKVRCQHRPAPTRSSGRDARRPAASAAATSDALGGLEAVTANRHELLRRAPTSGATCCRARVASPASSAQPACSTPSR